MAAERSTEGRPSDAAARDMVAVEPSAGRRQLLRLVRRIEALTREVEELKLRQGVSPELQAKERRLEQLRWRLATVARRSAADSQDAA